MAIRVPYGLTLSNNDDLNSLHGTGVYYNGGYTPAHSPMNGGY